MSGVGTTHHVKIGDRYYLVKPGSYQKRVAPQFGARFTTGDPDFNNLSIWQHWSQRCFVGGMDATDFADDAMYDDGVGVDTSEHEKVTLTRDLARGTGSNWALGGTSIARKFFVWNGLLYCVTMPAFGTASVVWKYDSSTDGWTSVKTFADLCARAVAIFDGKLFIGGRKLDNSAPRLEYATGSLGSWTAITMPVGIGTAAVDSLAQFQQRLYVCVGVQVWRMKDDETWDGNTVFYKVNSTSDSNGIAASAVHLGFLYLLSRNGHIHRTDGNSTFDIWSWDGNLVGVSIRSFDGRLFIGTYEYDYTAAGGYGVLYQMSGSAVTQLKRWGVDGENTQLGSLVVHDRKLFYGASNLLGMRAGFGIAMYDPIEDAHSIIASNGDTVTYARGSAPYDAYAVDDVINYGGYLWASVRGHGAFKTPYRYRDYWRGVRKYDISTAGGAPGAQNGGWMTSSTYDAGTPGLRKLWRKLSIDYLLPADTTYISVEYSLDGGTSWTLLSHISDDNGATIGARATKSYWLENQSSVSIKLRLTLRSTDGTKTPVMHGWLVSYIPLVEPNWMWTFTVVISEKPQLLDGTTATVDTENEFAYLRDLYRTKALVLFTGAEGDQWSSDGRAGVLIYDMTEWLPDLTQPLEGEVQLTLLEAVETY